MYESYFEAISDGREVRQQLAALRAQMKSEPEACLTEDQLTVLTGLLKHEDAKTRRNAALLLGDYGNADTPKALFEAWQAEQQLFVRSSYLKGLDHYDLEPFREALLARAQALEGMEMAETERKHLGEELHLLREMLMKGQKTKHHTFTGWDMPTDLILVTNPGLEFLTADALAEMDAGSCRELKGAVGLKTDHLRPLTKIRTVKEFLFRFTDKVLTGAQPESAAKALLSLGLLDYLEARHEGEGPFFFRIDMKTKLVLSEKSRYISRLAERLEALSGRRLINSESHYEISLRLMEDRQGRYHPYLELMTIRDRRFEYRQAALATSLHPVKAAETIALVKDYLSPDAIVLDPMCGVGTLLIERRKALPARSLYGVDIYGDAILGGRQNAGQARINVYFVNRDLSDFRHSYSFDELITEMPAISGKMDAKSLRALAVTLIRRLPEWMSDGAPVIIRSSAGAMLKQLIAQTPYLKKEAFWQLPGNREESVIVARYRRL